MRNYDMKDVVESLGKGLTLTAPISIKPSEAYPFRAIVEAAEGNCRLTRKRFVRLIMSTGNGRRIAERLAFVAHRIGMSYREILQKTVLQAIYYADEQMKNINGAVVEVVLNSDEAEQ